MDDFKNILRIALSVAGVVVGAGFASGQEILQFFSGFGYLGILGAIISGVLFALLGASVGSVSQVKVSKSYKDGIYIICGKYLGVFVDIMVTFFMFAMAIVMFAGGGSVLEQHWGVSAQIGSIIVIVITVLLVCMRVEKIISFIGAVTPILILMVVIISIYAWFTQNASIEELNAAAKNTAIGASNWFIAALLYVSYNMVVGGPFILIAGSIATSRRNVVLGGLLGGSILGVLILLTTLGVLSRINDVGTSAVPMLIIAAEMSPTVSNIMAVVIFMMIISTAVGVFYSFVARVFKPETKQFKFGAAASGLVGYLGSKIGFITLVGTVYPFFGYLGFVLMAAILIGWFRLRNK